MNRVATAFDLGSDHEIFLVNLSPHGFDINRLVTHLAECAGIGAYQQQLELVLQAFLLFGCGFAPTGANGQGGHAAEINVLNQLDVDQLHDFGHITVLQAFVGFDRVQRFHGHAFDERIRGLVSRQAGQWPAQTQGAQGTGQTKNENIAIHNWFKKRCGLDYTQGGDVKGLFL